MNQRTARFLLGVALPAALVAVGLAPFLALRSRLPARVATHFALSGSPDASMTPEGLLAFCGGLIVVGLGCCVLTATKRGLPSFLAAGVSFSGAFVAGIGSAMLAVLVISQGGLESWQDAAFDPWLLLVVLLVGALAGGTGARLGALAADEPADVGGRPFPPMRLAPGEHAVWSSTLHARWPLLVTVILLALAGGVAFVTSIWMTVILMVLAAAASTFSRIEVIADRNGLHLRFGLLGFPRISIPVASIEQATPIDVRPSEWGGWGYRGSLRLMNQASVVLRGGPGIRLDLEGGKVFVVTVDEPQAPASLLNAYT